MRRSRQTRTLTHPVYGVAHEPNQIIKDIGKYRRNIILGTLALEDAQTPYQRRNIEKSIQQWKNHIKELQRYV